MKVKYFSDTDTADVEFTDGVVYETKEISENIFQMTVDKAEDRKAADAFLNFGGATKSHMVGHGIGLECTEPPIISKYDHSEVSRNYVMALEMHMYREDVGVVKLEDMILITNSGNEILTKSPRHLFGYRGGIPETEAHWVKGRFEGGMLEGKDAATPLPYSVCRRISRCQRNTRILT